MLCRWSDHISVTVARAAAPEEDGRPVGPFDVTPEEMQVGVRGPLLRVVNCVCVCVSHRA